MGFHNMNPKQRKAICSKGGKAAHAQGKAHCFTSEEAKKAGAKGGATVSADKKHMSEIGKKGGASVSANREHMQSIGRKGGNVVSADKGHMREIGRKGGNAKATKVEEQIPPTSRSPVSDHSMTSEVGNA